MFMVALNCCLCICATLSPPSFINCDINSCHYVGYFLYNLSTPVSIAAVVQCRELYDRSTINAINTTELHKHLSITPMLRAYAWCSMISRVVHPQLTTVHLRIGSPYDEGWSKDNGKSLSTTLRIWWTLLVCIFLTQLTIYKIRA